MRSLKTSEVAEILKISVDTARLLGDEGVIKSYRTEGNHRRFYIESVYAYRDSMLGSKEKKNIIYIPCASSGKEAKESICGFCEKLGWSYYLLEESDNVCFEESSIKKLIGLIEKDEVNRIIIDTMDKFDEKEFNCIKEICSYHDVQIIVISDVKRELGFECLMSL